MTGVPGGGVAIVGGGPIVGDGLGVGEGLGVGLGLGLGEGDGLGEADGLGFGSGPPPGGIGAGPIGSGPLPVGPPLNSIAKAMSAPVVFTLVLSTSIAKSPAPVISTSTLFS